LGFVVAHHLASIELLQTLDHAEFEQQFCDDRLSGDFIREMFNEIDGRLFLRLLHHSLQIAAGCIIALEQSSSKRPFYGSAAKSPKIAGTQEAPPWKYRCSSTISFAARRSSIPTRSPSSMARNDSHTSSIRSARINSRTRCSASACSRATGYAFSARTHTSSSRATTV